MTAVGAGGALLHDEAVLQEVLPRLPPEARLLLGEVDRGLRKRARDCSADRRPQRPGRSGRSARPPPRLAYFCQSVPLFMHARSRGLLLDHAVFAELARVASPEVLTRARDEMRASAGLDSLDSRDIAFAAAAAGAGRLDNLECLVGDATLGPTGRDARGADSGLVSATAAMHGRIAALRWLDERGWRMPLGILCERAARSGSLPTLEWAHGRVIRGLAAGEPLSTLSPPPPPPPPSAPPPPPPPHLPPPVFNPDAITMVRDLPCLRFMRAVGCPLTVRFAAAAMLDGRADLVEWAMGEGPAYVGGDTLNAAVRCAATGHPGVVSWGMQRTGEGGPPTTRYRYRFVEWLRSKGVRWDARWSLAVAALEGDAEGVRWLHDGGCPACELSFSWAARGGHVEVMELLRSLGCPVDGDALAWAAVSGHLPAMDWLRRAGAPRDDGAIGRLAAYREIGPAAAAWLGAPFYLA